MRYNLSTESDQAQTCLLSAIALQYVQAQALPEIDYLTLADRVYATCYTLIGAAVLQTIFTNHLVRKKKRDLAITLDRWSRWLFPAALIIGVALSIWRAAA